jgi:serine/threonine protein kinase
MIVHQIADGILLIKKGMNYLHNREYSIIHKDLKPENILLDEYLNVKITDFGVSNYEDVKITQNGQGTPLYQSPEQFPQKNKPLVGKYSDVFSFGCIIYEILFERVIWSIEKIEMYDQLYHMVVFEVIIIFKRRKKHQFIIKMRYQMILNLKYYCQLWKNVGKRLN